MKNDWIIDVLNDLRCFAMRNELPALADQLDDTIHVAALEMAAQGEGSPAGAGKDGGQTRHPYRVHAASDNA